MTAKHTPGPWELDSGRTIRTASWDFYLSYGRDKHNNPLFRDFCELDRNARLIAAAPDLLAALIELEHVESSPHSETVRFFAREQARAAIAKATGQ